MSEPKTDPGTRVVQIGPDRVTIKETEVVIEAKRKMPDWEVREIKPRSDLLRRQKILPGRTAQMPGPIRRSLLAFPVARRRIRKNKIFPCL